MAESRIRGRVCLIVAATLAVALAGALVIGLAGTSLVVSDPLTPARAIVVFAGHIPHRAKEAAALYERGWAPEIWLTRTGSEDAHGVPARMRDAEQPEHLHNRHLLMRLGVPADAIRILDGEHFSTAGEVRTVARHLLGVSDGAPGAHRQVVILVTSSYHSRRVRTIWRAVAGGSATAAVRYPAADPFPAERWWEHRDHRRQVSREWFGLVNAWLGLPFESRRW